MKINFLGVISLFIFLVFFSGTLAASEGNDTGNGGNAIVCRDPDGSVRSAELLDLYEGRVLRGIRTDLGPASLSYPEKIELALKRLETFSPARAEKYRARAAEFDRDSLMLPGVTLVEVPDSDHLAVPAGCSRMQLVIQRVPAFPEDKRYTISKDIWDHLDNDSRAATVLHELIYREAFEENHHTNSVSSRYFNSILVSDRMNTLTLKDFADLLTRLPFVDTGFRGWGEWPTEVG